MTPQVLLVDDNAIQASTRNMILSRTGLRVALAENAQEALDMLEHADILSSLRLVITDHLMPGMNGPGLVQRLRTLSPDIPVLVLSGLADAEPEYEGLDVSFHLKPFPPEELIEVVHLLIGNPALRSA